MRIISVNCGMPQTISWNGKDVRTSIFKTPVTERVQITKLNVEGDRQSDLRVHGGVDKAVYSYAAEDLEWWSRVLGIAVNPGAFGENLTTEGLDESTVFVGDTVKAGTAVLQVVQPRLPCSKLGIAFNDEKMPKRFMEAARFGIYFRVMEEGDVAAGDSIEIVDHDPQHVSIRDLAMMVKREGITRDLVERTLAIPSLNQSWREKLLEAIWKEDHP